VPKMIIFYYGSDTYRMKRKLKEVIADYKEKNRSGFNFQVFQERKLILTT